MCGIFGTISRKTKPFNKRAFCTMGVRNDSRGGDSCGIFIDGQSEYGIDKSKLFINFFRDSILLDTTTECRVALGHCRKASVGKVSLEAAQPVVLYNEEGKVDYVLIHNGTIYNYEDLAKKYIPDVDIKGLTDSQVMARIFYYKGYDALNEYIGGAVFVIHDYRIDRSFVFKGESKKTTYSKEATEERPLFYCWHNGRFVFSSIFETLYAFYYEETIYTLYPNKLAVIGKDKLKIVHEYPRTECTQDKPIISRTVYYGAAYDDDCWFEGDYYRKSDNRSEKISHDGFAYVGENKMPLHGVFLVSAYGYMFPNKKKKTNWLHEVGFFMGRMLKHPKAFEMLDKKYQEANKVVTKEIEVLLNILDFNPYSYDLYQYYWYDDYTLVVPQGEWKVPMADLSYVFNDNGEVLEVGKKAYTGWVVDYNMYTYDESKILEAAKKVCTEG